MRRDLVVTVLADRAPILIILLEGPRRLAIDDAVWSDKDNAGRCEAAAEVLDEVALVNLGHAWAKNTKTS